MTHPFSQSCVEAAAKGRHKRENNYSFSVDWEKLPEEQRDYFIKNMTTDLSAAFEQSRAEGNAMDGGQYLTNSGDYHYFDLGKNHGLSALVTIIRKAKP